MLLTLLGAIAALLLWVVLAFVRPVGYPAVHLLYAVGVTLLVRWIALRDTAAPER